MSASDIRKLAREALAGKWGKAVLLLIVYALLSGLISGVLGLIPVVGQIAQTIIEIPLTFGFLVSMFKLKRGEEVSYTEFISNGFSNFKGSWMVTIWTAIRLIVPIVLVIVACAMVIAGFGTTALNSTSYYSTPSIAVEGTSTTLGIIGAILLIPACIWLTTKSYYYKLTLLELADNPEKDAKAVVDDSAKKMEGNRWRLFCLEFSFIGWIILASIAFGIGMLWVAPYMLVAEIVFFEKLGGKADAEVEAVEPTEVSETE